MSDVSSPKATRQSRPRWLDPKLFLGILLVLASMALGARVVAQADQTVEVWALRDDVDLASTVPLRQSALVAKRVQFTSQDDADLYVSAREPVPDGARMIRAVSAGELLPRNSWTNKPDSELNDAPIPVAPGLLPRGLQQGDRIDIYFVPANDDTFPPKEGVLAASDVVLVELPSAESFGGGAEASATIRVAPDELSEGMPITQLVANASNAKAVIIKHVAPEPR